jgi:uncharacterized membrane protein YqhA
MSGFGQAGEVSAAVMGATDAFLFGVVLIIFAYAIAFGFVFQRGGKAPENIPGLMHVESVSELKHILVEVIIVYLWSILPPTSRSAARPWHGKRS